MISFTSFFMIITGARAMQQDQKKALVSALAHTIRKADYATFNGLYANKNNSLSGPKKIQLSILACSKLLAADHEQSLNNGAIYKSKMIKGIFGLGFGLATGYFVYKGMSPDFFPRNNAALENSFSSVIQSSYATAKICLQAAAWAGPSALVADGLLNVYRGYNYQNHLINNFYQLQSINKDIGRLTQPRVGNR